MPRAEELLTIIQSDDATKISELVKNANDANEFLEFEDENIPEMLQEHPPIISAAAFYGATNCFNYLFKLGAKLDSLDENEVTILQFAVMGESPDILETIYSNGISFPYIGFFALRKEKFGSFFWLLDHKHAKIDEIDFTKSSYLHVAASLGNVEIFNKIINLHDFDANAKDYMGRTPLHIACGEGHKDIVELLMKNPKVDPSIEDNFNRIAVYYAHAQERWDIVNIFFNGDINKFLENGQTQLMVASRKGNINLVRFLLEMPELNINLQNSYGLAALHFASRFNEYEIVEELLRHEAINVNIQDNFGKTPLHYAKEANSEDIITLLLKHHANPDITDKEGHKPLEEITNTDPNTPINQS
ncbi:ankyrin repeat protein, putative [Trichomonas vaginalis G3]|uniref:Ankyrin repeat protein, putative n=1 Tax=Trichomonas vaginalis (strain ATCC PRA-98 / G3) TaxID=412133 RepID=A2E0Z9_TRIV3|nr:spectrin binding [Trichomonas vaginalis G3]EAY13631.1 ankyrin repeat protein, putative [Trichomonas vaginalis G3]KAI5529898.1 spectrin binding [Trichomonas vaginalis G3]|eukprot:XP_001325854.1 ankyrin repeat protein [Trichomonas vaginalis G3]